MDDNAARARVERQRKRLMALEPGTEAYGIAFSSLRMLQDDVEAFARIQQVLDTSWQKILREPNAR